MRILQIGASMHSWAGIPRYISLLTGGLESQGHEVVIVCPPNSSLAKSIPGGKALIGAPQPPKGKYRQRWRNLAPLIRLMRAQPFDVVHSHYSQDFSISAIAAKLARQPRIVMTRHLALHWSKPKAGLYNRLYDHFIGVSGAVKDALVASGIPESKVSVARMGLPDPPELPSRDKLRQDLGLHSDDFVVGFFGRLIKEKGVDVLLKAATSDPNWSLEIVGDGPLRGPLEAQSEELGISRRTTFRGFVDNPLNLMAAMSVVAIPSTWDEAFPAVALEAMSLGLPIVGSRTGGLPEMIQDGEDGLLAERGDADSLRRCLSQIEHDSELGSRLAANAQRRQRQEFSLDAMVGRFERIYAAVPVSR